MRGAGEREMNRNTHEVIEALNRKRQDVVTGFLWVFLAVVAAAVTINLFQFQPDSFDLSTHWPNLVLIVVLAVAVWLNRQGRFLMAMWAVTALLLLAGALPLLMRGTGDDGLALLILFVPVTFAGLLMGRGPLVLSAAVALAAALLGEYLQPYGGLTGGAEAGTPDWPVAIQFGLVLAIITLFLERFGSSLDTALDALVRRELALTAEIRRRQLAQERLAMAFSVARMASYEMDYGTRTVTGSNNLESLYGLEHTGRPRRLDEFVERVHPEDRAELLPGGDLDERARPEREVTFRVVGEDGEIRYLTAVSKLLLDEQGRPERIVGVVIDMTETRRAQLGLRELNESLEERIVERTQSLEAANRELETFAYSVSHDLRAPLRAVAGFSEILNEDYRDVLDETARYHLLRIQSAADRMGELIDDLLKLSRLSAEQLRRENVDLGKLAQEIAADLNDRQPERRVVLRTVGDLTVNGDRKLLQISMQNLLDNAWKFMGDRRNSLVELIAERTEDGERVFCLRDNGVGFDMEYAGRIFLPFQRLDALPDAEGSGIGLATVQRVVQRHGGRIWVDSRRGEGTTFFFTLGGVDGAGRAQGGTADE